MQRIVNCHMEFKEYTINKLKNSIPVQDLLNGMYFIKTTSRDFKKCIKKKQLKVPKVIFLQNNGLVVSGENVRTVLQTTEEVIQRTKKFLGIPDRKMTEMETFRIWPLTPDEVVYCGKRF